MDESLSDLNKSRVEDKEWYLVLDYVRRSSREGKEANNGVSMKGQEILEVRIASVENTTPLSLEDVLETYKKFSSNPFIDCLKFPFPFLLQFLKKPEWEKWEQIFRNLAKRDACIEISLEWFLNLTDNEIVSQFLEWLKIARNKGVRFILTTTASCLLDDFDKQQIINKFRKAGIEEKDIVNGAEYRFSQWKSERIIWKILESFQKELLGENPSEKQKEEFDKSLAGKSIKLAKLMQTIISLIKDSNLTQFFVGRVSFISYISSTQNQQKEYEIIAECGGKIKIEFFWPSGRIFISASGRGITHFLLADPPCYAVEIDSKGKDFEILSNGERMSLTEEKSKKIHEILDILLTYYEGWRDGLEKLDSGYILTLLPSFPTSPLSEIMGEEKQERDFEHNSFVSPDKGGLMEVFKDLLNRK